LTIVWLLLVNKVTVGNLILGFALGVIIPFLTEPYWEKRPPLKKPFRIIEYVLLVLWDICVANVIVAGIILTKSNRSTQSQWVRIPLDLKKPEAITVLAGTITMTPGTVSSCLSADASEILVHALDAPNPDAVRDEIKRRYERRLKEIFE